MASQFERVFLQQGTFVCRSCQNSLRNPRKPVPFRASIRCPVGDNNNAQSSLGLQASRTSVRHVSSSSLRNPFAQQNTTNTKKPTTTPPPSKKDTLHPADELRLLKTHTSSIKSATVAADENEVQRLVEDFENFANVIVLGGPRSIIEAEEQGSHDTASSTLSDLEEAGPKRKASQRSNELPISFRAKSAETICELLYNLVRDEKVFISPTVLDKYVRIQCLLGRPEYLPEIFYLYANKPIAQPKTTPIRYRKQSPNSPKNAIPMHLSDMALDAAIAKKDLPLAITIIDQTVAKPAFRRNKLLRKASLPAIAVGATPVCAYAGAHWVSQWQNVWDPEMATTTAMAGSLAYIGTLTIIGYVAVTTFNDHHDRVVWVIGTPLRHRWMKEEERLYFDRLANAWGFQHKWKRGEEQGEEWEALREVIGMREMVLDKTELMEGME